jgi:16S rRNA (guanine966-N2)-methyltransferase
MPNAARTGLRVIAGEYRRRRLEVPDAPEVRPMLDRVKTALFSVIGPLLPDARVLDAFAGSGALGIEAISRGAAHARFVERHPACLTALRRNLETLGLGPDRATVQAGEVGAALKALADGPERFDLIFYDPPFSDAEALPGGPLAEDGPRLARLLAGAEARVVFRYPSEAPGLLAGLELIDRRRWGRSGVSLLAAGRTA